MQGGDQIWAENKSKEIEGNLTAILIPPNQNQIGVALAALFYILKGSMKRIFLTAPPGKGKSRILGGIIAGLTTSMSTINNFVVVFPSEELMK